MNYLSGMKKKKCHLIAQSKFEKLILLPSNDARVPKSVKIFLPRVT